ncbi:MAG: formylglycine-generating enzyme family protein, partial [Ferruginibacter sp.]
VRTAKDDTVKVNALHNISRIKLSTRKYDESTNYYSSSPSNNPKGHSSGSDRVIRGGCWLFDSKNICRSASRRYEDSCKRQRIIGFRVVAPFTFW